MPADLGASTVSLFDSGWRPAERTDPIKGDLV